MTVKLATGAVQLRQCKETGTLLTTEPVQAIVPVSKMLQTGYNMMWTKDECVVENAGHQRLPVTMVQGCPTVNKECGDMLMDLIEVEEKKKARISAILGKELEPETEYEKNVAETQKMFPEVPAYLIENVACDGQWNADRLPWNRRKRRAIEKAKFVVLHLYSGDDDKTWKQLERQSHGVEVIQVELKKGADMRNNDLTYGLPGGACKSRSHRPSASGTTMQDSKHVQVQKRGTSRSRTSTSRRTLWTAEVWIARPRPCRAEHGRQRYSFVA